MISLEVNLSILVGSFLCFLLTYICFVQFKALRKTKEPDKKNESPFKKNIFLLFVSFNFIFTLQLLAKSLASADNLFINVIYFQGLLAVAYIFSACMNINLLFKNEKASRIIMVIFTIFIVPLAYIWLKTNILDGFHPLIRNSLLLDIVRGGWVLSGFILCATLGIVALNKNEIDKAFNFSLARLFAFLYVLQFIGMFFSSSMFNFYYVLEAGSALILLFLVNVVASSEFISIEYYKRPSLFLKNRIIFRMILTLAVFIVIALELVNYATLYIVKMELVNSKLDFFKNKAGQVERSLNDFYERNRLDIEKYIAPYARNNNSYFVGIDMFNEIGKKNNILKVFVLSAEGVPIMQISSSNLNFAYETRGYDFGGYVKEFKNKKYLYKFNTDTKKAEIFIATFTEKQQVQNFFLFILDTKPVFSAIEDMVFEKNGEIEIYANGYKLIYTTSQKKAIREEVINGKYLESFILLPMLNLIVAVRQPVIDAFSGLQKAQYNSFFFTTLAIILFLLITLMFLRIIEKPIRTLQEGAKVIGRGNLNYEIIIKEKNEFSELALAFNNMVTDIKRLQKEQLKKEQLLSITQMSVGLNHEINNPVATILMGSQLMLKVIEKLEGEAVNQDKLILIKNTALQVMEESKKITKILKDIQNIQEPIIEEYVDGITMIKVKFD